MNSPQWPRTDIGTVLLHWIMVIATVVLLLTGLRFASDDAGHGWLRVFDRQLATQNLWVRHTLAGYALTAVAAGYAIYMSRGRLVDRIRLNAARMQGLFGPPRMRWSCVNVLLYWAFLLAVLGAISTGYLIFYEVSGPYPRIHLLCAWVILAFPVLHLFALLRLGGLPQVLRIFRPRRATAIAEEIDLASVVSDLLAEKRAAQKATKIKSDRPG